MDRELVDLLAKGLGLITVLALGLGIAVPSCRESSKVYEARGDIRALVEHGIANWRVDFGSKCPPNIRSVVRYVESRPRSSDPWGTPYRVHCLPGYWPQVFSAGPDRIFDTCDDITKGD